MKKDKLANILYSKWGRLLLVLFGISFLFAFWAIISHCLNSPVLPGPDQVMTVFFSLLTKSDTYLAVAATFLRLLFAFTISFAFAFIVGLIAGMHPSVKTFLSPLMMVLKTVPTATFVYAFFVYFENNLTLFLVIFLVMFPILYEAISNGVNNIDDNIIKALRVDCGLHAPRAIFKVLIPSAAPYILLGVVQTLGLGMKVSIMAEILIGQRDMPGIGVNIINSYVDGLSDYIYAHSIFAIIVIGLIDFARSLISKRINYDKK